jgi:hypothetical protein
MLSGVGLGYKLWEEGMGTACYLVNQSPSSTLDNNTPHKVWSGKKPSLTHLRVFVCEAYIHVPKEKRSKPNKNDEKITFIGYKYGLKGYKRWNLENKKIVYN